MLTILKLFGRSPFAPLQAHMELVSDCVHKLPALFTALDQQDYATLETVAESISTIEHEADIIKNNIRNHLPKSLYLPIDRSNLLNILSLQDQIADKAEDVAVLTMLKKTTLPPFFKEEFNLFLRKNIEAFDEVFKIIKELNELVESSFGGIEAEKVRAMVETVSYKEHEVDVIQRKLLIHLFNAENQMSYTTFYQWQKICENLAAISNTSETLANRVRMTLELK